jgi:hypothetical protein
VGRGPLGQVYLELYDLRRTQELADYDRQIWRPSRTEDPEPPSGARADSPAPDRDPDMRDMSWEPGQ